LVSYVTEFVSENREIYRSMPITRAWFPDANLRFVGDSGLDDQKIFRWMDLVKAGFVIRAQHNRTVEVYNERLQDLAAAVYLPLTLRVTFTRARKVRVVNMEMGWLKVRLPDTKQVLWLLGTHGPERDRDLALITNVPIHTAEDAETVYTQWCYRPQIEHTYRFDQEDGLDVEDVRVQTLERMPRIFALMLMAALFVCHIAEARHQRMVLLPRHLGGKLGLSSDRDELYVLLAGIRAVFVTAATLAFASQHAFPR
jgi:hypothetical protein